MVVALLGATAAHAFLVPQGLEPLNKREGAESLEKARTRNENDHINTGFIHISELCAQIPRLFVRFAEAEETRQKWIQAADLHLGKNKYDYFDVLTQYGVRELLYFLHSTQRAAIGSAACTCPGLLGTRLVYSLE